MATGTGSCSHELSHFIKTSKHSHSLMLVYEKHKRLL